MILEIRLNTTQVQEKNLKNIYLVKNKYDYEVSEGICILTSNSKDA